MKKKKNELKRESDGRQGFGHFPIGGRKVHWALSGTH